MSNDFEIVYAIKEEILKLWIKIENWKKEVAKGRRIMGLFKQNTEMLL